MIGLEPRKCTKSHLTQFHLHPLLFLLLLRSQKPMTSTQKPHFFRIIHPSFLTHGYPVSIPLSCLLLILFFRTTTVQQWICQQNFTGNSSDFSKRIRKQSLKFCVPPPPHWRWMASRIVETPWWGFVRQWMAAICWLLFYRIWAFLTVQIRRQFPFPCAYIWYDRFWDWISIRYYSHSWRQPSRSFCWDFGWFSILQNNKPYRHDRYYH